MSDKMMEHKNEIRDTNNEPRTRPGTVLILAIVLTSLLAVIGVMFVLTAQVDKTATSAISENRELNFAIETVIARISQEMVKDVPGVAGAEYYDYPGDKDPWLASLEPYDKGAYKWPQISDVTGYIDQEWGSLKQKDVDVEIVEAHERIKLDIDGDIETTGGQLADADGDGVADSKWIKLDNITSGKAKPIFAAIRVVDNGGMLNINTVFANPGGSNVRKGNMLTNIYIDGLVKSSPTESVAIDNFIENRSGDPSITELAAQQYHTEVCRRIENPFETDPPYTLYDISEELSLRNRCILYPDGTITRLEAGSEGDPDRCLSTTLRWSGYGNSYAPYTVSDFAAWERRFDPFDDNEEPNENNYDFRHLLTTHNMDRIIDANDAKMVYVNDFNNAQQLFEKLYKNIIKYEDDLTVDEKDDYDGWFAQIAADIKDYGDSDDFVTVVTDTEGGTEHYGFETPCIYISELAYAYYVEPIAMQEFKSYAIELYKPYSEDNNPSGWQVVIDNPSRIIPIDWSSGSQFYVIRWENPLIPINVDPNAERKDMPFVLGDIIFQFGSTIALQRPVPEAEGGYITVDSVDVDGEVSDWLFPTGGEVGRWRRSYQRDITRHKCIRRLWDDTGSAKFALTLGKANSYIDPDPKKIQAHPESFRNVGEIGKVFRRKVQNSLYWNEDEDWNGLTTTDEVESVIRCDLADPYIQKMFKYLTVFDPTIDGINNDGDDDTDETDLDKTPEFKIPGRININTAPWYVIAQLPWVDDTLAEAVAAYRDRLQCKTESSVDYVSGRFNAIQSDIDSRFEQDDIREELGFATIGELNFVIAGNDPDYSIRYHQLNSGDLPGFPDLTPGGSLGDDAPDDFEERDVIFHRISDLVTVRSDVFTAYILVRIGADGPQKRAIAILDRSNVYQLGDKVKVIAVHPVPDPR